MHKKYFTITFLFAALTLSCGRTFGIERGIRPNDSRRGEVKNEVCSIMRTGDIEAAVTPVDTGDWERIFEYEPYCSKSTKVGTYRVPRLLFFHITVANKGSSTITVDPSAMKLAYGEAVAKPLAKDAMAARFASPAYAVFNFANILTAQHLNSNAMCPREINFEKDTGGPAPPAIEPGGRIMVFAAFDWVPVEFRRMTLSLEIAGDEKKSIDFGFTRFEYRTRGKYFTKPDKPSGSSVDENR